jgi:hypothetical protein
MTGAHVPVDGEALSSTTRSARSQIDERIARLSGQEQRILQLMAPSPTLRHATEGTFGRSRTLNSSGGIWSTSAEKTAGRPPVVSARPSSSAPGR